MSRRDKAATEVRFNFRDRVRQLVQSILRSQGEEKIALVNIARNWWVDLGWAAKDDWAEIAGEEVNAFWASRFP